MRGRGIGSWLSGAQKFLKSHQAISKGAAYLAPMLSKDSLAGRLVGSIGTAASSLGYGRRRRAARMTRRYRGGALRLAGM
jgi:hypothetical protein